MTAREKWRAITVGTLTLVPGYWLLLSGLVALEADAPGAPDPATALAFGVAAMPFTFLALALLSRHPNPGAAVLKAMGAAILVGIAASALAGDAVTGLVAAAGAGGMFALPREHGQSLRPRMAAVAITVVYAFVLARVAPALVLLPAPIFPFTALGLADHWASRGVAGRVPPASVRT